VLNAVDNLLVMGRETRFLNMLVMETKFAANIGRAVSNKMTRSETLSTGR
jgi:hypothetical protein